MRRLFPLLAVTVALACGDDDPTGPSQADVGGVWRITFSNMSNSGISCSSNTSDMSLTMSGVTFSGTYGPINLSCTNGTGTFQKTLQGAIVNGTVANTAVSFDLDSPNFHQTGTASACLPGECAVPSPNPAIYMSGTAQWTMDLGGGQTAALNGSWSATKQ
jgi:hypothetical protein